jgi:hypothetical protein
MRHLFTGRQCRGAIAFERASGRRKRSPHCQRFFRVLLASSDSLEIIECARAVEGASLMLVDERDYRVSL